MAKPRDSHPPSRPRSRAEKQGGEPERLQKVLAQSGVASRRGSEELILQGRVSLNGQVVRELGVKVPPSARIEVDGQPIHVERPVYLAVHKPKGYVSTNNDPSGRPRVVDLVSDVSERVYSVGRLDEESTGLMILTNDGELANRLAHPRFGVEKVYRALVAGRPDRTALDALVRGVWLSDGKARARRVRVIGDQGDATLVEMVLAEGKNREVRRMWAKLGHKVMRLTRVAIGPVSIKHLKAGHWRHLTGFEVAQLQRLARGESVPTASVGEPMNRSPQRPRRGAARHAPPESQAGHSAALPRPPRIADAGHVPPPSQRRRDPPGRPPRPASKPRPPQGPGPQEVHEVEVGPWLETIEDAPPRRPRQGKPGRPPRLAPAPVTDRPKIVGAPRSQSAGGPAKRPRPRLKRPFKPRPGSDGGGSDA